MDCLRSLCCCGSADGRGWEDNEIEVFRSQALRFITGAQSDQHPLKATTVSVNADAYAVTERLMGVADGVSSVELEGFDPSKLPCELLRKCVALAELRQKSRVAFDNDTETTYASLDLPFYEHEFPKHILAQACAECHEMGSTTCCLSQLDGSKVRTVNIGDSQFLQLRRRTSYDLGADCRKRESSGRYVVVSRTKPQQHFFNCPFQLTRMPDVDCSYFEVLRRAALIASVTTHQVQAGDVIIVGTDGLFDNLFDGEIASILDGLWDSKTSRGSSITSAPPDTSVSRPPKLFPAFPPEFLAQKILEEALEAALPPGAPQLSTELGSARTRKPGRITPFTQSAAIELGRTLQGGKPDDTTVVVGYVDYERPSKWSWTSKTGNASSHRSTSRSFSAERRVPKSPSRSSGLHPSNQFQGALYTAGQTTPVANQQTVRGFGLQGYGGGAVVGGPDVAQAAGGGEEHIENSGADNRDVLNASGERTRNLNRASGERGPRNEGGRRSGGFRESDVRSVDQRSHRRRRRRGGGARADDESDTSSTRNTSEDPEDRNNSLKPSETTRMGSQRSSSNQWGSAQGHGRIRQKVDERRRPRGLISRQRQSSTDSTSQGAKSVDPSSLLQLMQITDQVHQRHRMTRSASGSNNRSQ